MSSNPPLDPAGFIARFANAAERAGFRLTRFGEIQGYPLLACVRSAPPGAPAIYVSSGIHGDEPAPPVALLRLLEEGFFDDRAHWYVAPLLNPTGFAARRRENFQGLDLNRDYLAPQSAEVQAHIAWLQGQPRFDLTLCVHEDWEATGFYLYELNPEGRPTLANAMITAAREHCPIDPAAVIDDRPVDEPGIIRPVSDPLLRERWPEAIYLRRHHCTLGYTLETPSTLPLEQRIATHRAVLRTAVSEFLARPGL
ncbi:MAG: M14 family metallocarboxypeptidase [Opitutales bacterium]